MNAEDIQRHHLEELRKERQSLSRTPSPASISSDGKIKRTARKSTRVSRRFSADTDSSSIHKDDDNSLASDASTSRDSRTSEQEEIRKIILGLEQDGDSSHSSKDSIESKTAGVKTLSSTSGLDGKVCAESLPVKPFLFSVSDKLFQNSSVESGSKKVSETSDAAPDSMRHEPLNALDEVANENKKSLQEISGHEEKSVKESVDAERDSADVKNAELKCDDGAENDEKKNEVLNDSKSKPLITKKDNEDITVTNSSSEKQPEKLDDIAKVWENIQKDLTCIDVDAKDDDKDLEFDPGEELPLGESLPHAEEEPSDWEEWEEPSDQEQSEIVDSSPKAPQDRECVLIVSDDENSKDASDAKVKASDEKKTEPSLKNHDNRAEKDGNTSFEETCDASDGEKLRLSESSDVEETSPTKVDSVRKNEDTGAEIGILLNTEKNLESKLEIDEVKYSNDSDEVAILEEKKVEKRMIEDVDFSSNEKDELEVKKVKLESPGLAAKEEGLADEKTTTSILSKKILEELISRKIKDFMADGNRNAFAALKDRCDALEKSVERWKFRAQHLQNQLNELVLEQKRYNSRKQKVATRTVGINVRMVQVQSPVSQAGQVKILPAPAQSGKLVEKIPTTRSGPVPCHLVANMALPTKTSTVTAASAQSVKQTTTTTMATGTTSTVKLIDLTQDEENAQKSGVIPALPPGTVIRPTVTLPSVVSVPMVQGGMSSVMQLIPTSATSITTGARLPTTNTMAQGARVTYFVPNTIGGPRQLVAIPPQNLLQNPRQPMQTILLRMNTVPQTGTATAQFVSSPVTNTTLSLVTSPAPIRVSTPKPPVSTAPSITTAAATTSQSAAPVNTVVISCLQKHPAPLPTTPVYPEDPKLKSTPPTPVLKISRVSQGIVLSWNMTLNVVHAEISVYQLYAYQETTGPPSTALWKKVGDVRALPLPMACTLTQFVQGHKYHFAVRAVDVNNRMGPFSDPASIILHTK